MEFLAVGRRVDWSCPRSLRGTLILKLVNAKRVPAMVSEGNISTW